MPMTIKLESHLTSEEVENRYRKAHDPVLRSHYQIAGYPLPQVPHAIS